MHVRPRLLVLGALLVGLSACKPRQAPPPEQPAPVDEKPAPYPAPGKPKPAGAPIIRRTWTAADGRTLDGILLKRFEDAVVIRRETDQREFTIPLSNLSPADHDYVKRTEIPIKPAFDHAEFDRLIRSMPLVYGSNPPPNLSQSLKSLEANLAAELRTVTRENIATHLPRLRNRVAAELRRLRPLADTVTRATVSSEVRDARAICEWLEGPLSRHLDQIAALAAEN